MINQLRDYIFYTWVNAFALGMDLIHAVWNIEKEEYIWSSIWIAMSIISFACFSHFRVKYLVTLEYLEEIEDNYTKIKDGVEYV